ALNNNTKHSYNLRCNIRPPRFIHLGSSEDPAPAGMALVEGGTLPAVSSLGELNVSAFEIGRFEVTWGEWKEVCAFAGQYGYDVGSVGSGCADDQPVHTVNWYDVVKWCNLKSELESLTPVYRVGGATYKTGQTIPSRNAVATGYRLL